MQGHSQKHWLMRRNCSFTPKQLGLFYLAQSAFALLVAIFFLWRGVPFILPFTLIELLVLAIALLIYARHTTDLEFVGFDQGMLEIRTINSGFEKNYRWNPEWVVVLPHLNVRQLLVLRYQGKEVELGKFIHISKRENFLKELQICLKSIKFGEKI